MLRRDALKKGVLAAGVTVGGINGLSGTSLAGCVREPEAGCTPGYWRNPAYRNSVWNVTGMNPYQLVGNLFESTYIEGDLGEMTLLEALGGGGGPGLEGAQRILFRAGVAAVLNAAHPEIDFGAGVSHFVDHVKDAIATQDRGEILAVAEELDAMNNLGCPLDAFGNLEAENGTNSGQRGRNGDNRGGRGGKTTRGGRP